MAMTTRVRRAALTVLLGMLATAVTGAATRGPDAGGYVATDAAVDSFIDLPQTGAAAILAGTDDGVVALSLPFAFQFYGHGYSTVCVSTNGALYLVGDVSSCAGISDFANTDLATTATPNDLPAVLPFWSDLSFEAAGAGAVFYQTTGVAGSRKFVVQWNNALTLDSPVPITFEAILFETTNRVLFQYRLMDPGDGSQAVAGGAATVGIRNAGALMTGEQLEWSFDAPVLGNASALSFTNTSAVTPVAVVVSGGTFTYDGQPHPASATATGAGGAPIPGTFTFTYNPGGSAAPVGAGSYQVTAAFSPADPAYAGGSGTGTITIDRATPTIVWANPAPIDEGTPLGSGQLNATVDAPGALVYTPPAGTVLDDGVSTLSVAFVPGDPADYNSATRSVTISVRPTPGQLEGAGQIETAGVRYAFVFLVRERASGSERGSLRLDVDRVGGNPRTREIGDFVSTAVDTVVFSDDPGLKPGRREKPDVDTASFIGKGRWNGLPGYTFTAVAADAGEPGRGRDQFTITVRSPQGAVVATVSGTITAGNIQSNRVAR